MQPIDSATPGVATSQRLATVGSERHRATTPPATSTEGDNGVPPAEPRQDPLRILLVAPPWFPVSPRRGGTELVIANLAQGLVARGHDVTVVTTGDAELPCTRWATFDRAPTAHRGDQGYELAHLVAAHGRHGDFDLVHDHTLLGAAMAAVASPTTPIVHTLHGPWTDGVATACRALSGRCDLVATSHDQAARAPGDVDIAAVIHHGMDLTEFPLNRVGGPHLAFIGRASRETSPHLAVDVARRLGRPMVMGVEADEPADRDYWRDVVEPRIGGHDDVIVVHDADHDQKVAIVGGAAAVLFPIQRAQPFGLVPIEANACGTPVVAFANDATPEVVADGRSGVLVDPRDGVEGLAAAVLEAERMSRPACRRHVEEHFGRDRMVDDHERLYRHVVARGSCSPLAGRRAHDQPHHPSLPAS